MKKKRLILLLAVLLVTIGVIWGVSLYRKAEPTYGGKTVNSWVKALGYQGGFEHLWAVHGAVHGHEDDPMRLAILTAALDKKDNALQKLWLRVLPKLPTWLKSHFSPPIPAELVRVFAAAAIADMKEYYKPAIPKLIHLVESKDLGMRFFAIRALGECLGAEDVPDDGEKAAALRVLTSALKDSKFRLDAAKAIKQIDPIYGTAIVEQQLKPGGVTDGQREKILP
jgi:hypothetical protein